ncbi:MAG: precorrin-6A reductase [Fibrobacter sp.]|nr:precorrin-6A reductase [Fibrobacter sp.]
MSELQSQVLVIGGTSDAIVEITSLLKQGYRVLHSRFSDAITLETPDSPMLKERFGALDTDGFVELIKKENIDQVVDAAHPFAEQVHVSAEIAACQCNIPYRRILRPDLQGLDRYSHIREVSSHDEAAQLCTQLGGTVLATIGSRNIHCYQSSLHKNGQILFARVLDDPQSVNACLQCGIPSDRIIQGRGPFSVADNLNHITLSGARIVVTKDSGEQGGIYQKIEAAQRAGCLIIIIKRPSV